MKNIALATAALLAGLSTGALAQSYERPIYERSPSYDRAPEQECWNRGANHFERVRPGETQNDLDFRRCHVIGYTVPDPRERRDVRERRQECWNPRAGHYEGVRPGDVQNDLDFNRCRLVQ